MTSKTSQPKPSTSTALVLPDDGDGGSFAIVQRDETRAALIENMTGLGLGAFDLNRVVMPSGQTSAWQIDGLEGPEFTPTIDIIVAHMVGNQRAFYRTSYEESGGGGAPDCSSQDGLMGFGVVTMDKDEEPAQHECASCPWNQWGSTRAPGGGNSKECAENIFLFFFFPSSSLPSLLTITPGSLKAWRMYARKLMDNGRSPFGVVTRLGLESATSDTGVAFQKLKPSYVCDLTEEQQEVMRDLREKLKPLLSTISINATPF